METRVVLADEGAERAGGETRGPHPLITGPALERAASALFSKMEHLDPTDDGDIEAEDWGWSKLTEHRKEFYRLCVAEILKFWSEFAALDFHINRIDPNDPSNRKERREESDDTYAGTVNGRRTY